MKGCFFSRACRRSTGNDEVELVPQKPLGSDGIDDDARINSAATAADDDGMGVIFVVEHGGTPGCPAGPGGYHVAGVDGFIRDCFEEVVVVFLQGFGRKCLLEVFIFKVGRCMDQDFIVERDDFHAFVCQACILVVDQVNRTRVTDAGIDPACCLTQPANGGQKFRCVVLPSERKELRQENVRLDAFCHFQYKMGAQVFVRAELVGGMETFPGVEWRRDLDQVDLPGEGDEGLRLTSLQEVNVDGGPVGCYKFTAQALDAGCVTEGAFMRIMDEDLFRLGHGVGGAWVDVLYRSSECWQMLWRRRTILSGLAPGGETGISFRWRGPACPE